MGGILNVFLLTVSFIQKNDAFNKIATYFDISNKENIELEIIIIKNDIESKAHRNEKKCVAAST